MAEVHNKRRLAAILAADVVGYSRMMATDEAGTLSGLKRHREAVFDPTFAANHGRIVKLIGDGTLVEFASVVDAVNRAFAIQRTLAGEVATGPKITLRIGVNLGDALSTATTYTATASTWRRGWNRWPSPEASA